MMAIGQHTDHALLSYNIFSALLFKNIFHITCPISYHINPNKNVIIHSVRKKQAEHDRKLQSCQSAAKHSSYKHVEEPMVGSGDSPPLHCPAYNWIQYGWTPLYTQGTPLKS